MIISKYLTKNRPTLIQISSAAIVFTHIPKAGGSSLIHFFRDILGKEKTFHHKARDVRTNKISPGIEDLSLELRQKYLFFAGHFNYGIHILINRPCLYIGVMRDPIDRIVSHYHYVRDRGPRHLIEVAKSKTLEEYLEHLIAQPSNPIRSSQIEYLTGQSDLEGAKLILKNHFLVFSTTPQLNDMQRLLADCYRRPDLAPKVVNTSQKSSGDKELSPNMLSELNSRYAKDYELFDWIKSEFQAVQMGIKEKTVLT